MTAESVTPMRELDQRLSGGIHVRLLWCSHDNSAWVSVVDVSSGQSFRVPVGAGQRALEVFRHPFAYAAQAGLGPRDPAPALAGG
jgi:hypothetical protein